MERRFSKDISVVKPMLETDKPPTYLFAPSYRSKQLWGWRGRRGTLFPCRFREPLRYPKSVGKLSCPSITVRGAEFVEVRGKYLLGLHITNIYAVCPQNSSLLSCCPRLIPSQDIEDVKHQDNPRSPSRRHRCRVRPALPSIHL